MQIFECIWKKARNLVICQRPRKQSDVGKISLQNSQTLVLHNGEEN